MKNLLVLVIVVGVLAPAVAAQTGAAQTGAARTGAAKSGAAKTGAAKAGAANFTGKWEGTFTMVKPDGTEGNSNQVVFNLTQKGKELTGTAGPADKQWKVDKGVVDAGKATFEVQQPDGPLFKFALTIVKDHLQGEMTGERDGVVRGHAKVDAAKAK
jgi:hypothetical protein